jgi:MEMO1 family protein
VLIKLKFLFGIVIGIVGGSILATSFYNNRHAGITEDTTLEESYVYYAAFSQKEYYENIFAAVPAPAFDNQTRIGVVNHHLLAPDFIAYTLAGVPSTTPMVILVSPNHFERGVRSVATTKGIWETPYGQLNTCDQAIDALFTKDVVGLRPDLFIEEHGINNLVGFIKKVAPQACLLPAVLKLDTTPEQVATLVRSITPYWDEEAVYIASVDFSHYLPSSIADIHDAYAIYALRTPALGPVPNIEVDSPASLAWLMGIADQVGWQKFTLHNHSNAGKRAKRPELIENTSWVAGRFEPGDAGQIPEVATYLFLPPAAIVAEPLPKKNPATSVGRIFIGNTNTFAPQDGQWVGIGDVRYVQYATSTPSGQLTFAYTNASTLATCDQAIRMHVHVLLDILAPSGIRRCPNGSLLAGYKTRSGDLQMYIARYTSADLQLVPIVLHFKQENFSF